MYDRLWLGVVGLLLVGSGCVTVDPQHAFEDVQEELHTRDTPAVVWRTNGAEDQAADAAVDSLLALPLTIDHAVQVALLNNRSLQATYAELGVAQAQLVQAGLLSNPIFGGVATWPFGEEDPPRLGLNVAFTFLDLLYRPLRRAVATQEYEAAKLRVTGTVLDHAVLTEQAYYMLQAALSQQTLQQRILDHAAAAYEAALLLREAGNTPAVDVLVEQSAYEQARLDLLLVQQTAIDRQEALVRQLGLYGPAITFALPGELPAVPEAPPVLAGLRTRSYSSAALPSWEIEVDPLVDQALARSLALAAHRADLDATAQRLGLTDAERLLPDLEVGGELEREDGAWHLGPEVEVVLPVFDQGQARRAALLATLRRQQALYYAEAVAVRSAVRAQVQRLSMAHGVAQHYQRVVLPLQAALVQQFLRQYNAMQVGVFQLIQVQQREAETARAYLDALADYWATQAELDALLRGRGPTFRDAMEARPRLSSSMPEAPGH
ncbi:MAG: TolC family protein [Bacteroidota bacterium]